MTVEKQNRVRTLKTLVTVWDSEDPLTGPREAGRSTQGLLYFPKSLALLGGPLLATRLVSSRTLSTPVGAVSTLPRRTGVTWGVHSVTVGGDGRRHRGRESDRGATYPDRPYKPKGNPSLPSRPTPTLKADSTLHTCGLEFPQRPRPARPLGQDYCYFYGGGRRPGEERH